MCEFKNKKTLQENQAHFYFLKSRSLLTAMTQTGLPKLIPVILHWETNPDQEAHQMLKENKKNTIHEKIVKN